MDENLNLHTEPAEEPQGSAFPDPAAPADALIPQQLDGGEQDAVAEGTLPEMPPEQTEGAFYGDPSAPTVSQPAQYQYTYQPVPPQPVPAMNRRIYTMAAVIAVLIFLLSLFCIISDLLHGALGGADTAAVNEVIIKTQPKPELDPEDVNVSADGTYTVRGIAELVKPSIVEIYAFLDDSYSESQVSGTGSGVIVSEDGYIVTNAHVLEGEAFLVILEDGTEYEGSVIGSDNKTDLAVLKIEASDLPAAMLGDSDEVAVGENVVAIGNPAGLTGTVTQGIVSAVDRQVRAESNAFIMNCIQTDAAISPGNSGGALVNMYGQVIGITSSKYASSYITGNVYEGLGFAITINQALPIIEELISQGYVSGRFRIGITFLEAALESSDYYYEQEFGEPIPDGVSGLWIQEISEDCDIAGTELQVNDFLMSMNGTPVDGYDTVLEVLDGFEGGDEVTAECARVEENGEITYFEITFLLEEDTSGNY